MKIKIEYRKRGTATEWYGETKTMDAEIKMFEQTSEFRKKVLATNQAWAIIESKFGNGFDVLKVEFV